MNVITKSLCEIRPGIGLCDECSLPKWPQRYMGYGFMVCEDCLAAEMANAKPAKIDSTKEARRNYLRLAK